MIKSRASFSRIGRRRFIKGAAFSPASIAGLVAWFDASDAATVWADTAGTPAVSGGLIRCWKDKVAAYSADQATGSYQPTLATTGGIGARSVQFGGLHALDITSLPIARFAVIAHKSTSGARASLMGSYPLATSTNFELHTSGFGKARYFYRGVDLGYSTSIHASGSATVSTWATGPVAVAAGWQFYRNGVLDGTVTPSALDAVSSPWRIGADHRAVNPSAAIPLTGHIGEICLYSATPSESDLAALHNYLLAKWL